MRISKAEDGFTYVGLLVAVALVGVGLAVTGDVWRTTVQREKERELLFIGDEFRRAIVQYYDSTPGAGKQFPKSFDELLRDPRYPTIRRYLRKVYRDPMTGKREWGIVKGPGDTIMGVHSLAKGAPVKRANFPAEYAYFEKAESYVDWRFVYSDPRGPQTGPGTSQASAPAPGMQQPFASPIPTSTVTGPAPTTPADQGAPR